MAVTDKGDNHSMILMAVTIRNMQTFLWWFRPRKQINGAVIRMMRGQGHGLAFVDDLS